MWCYQNTFDISDADGNEDYNDLRKYVGLEWPMPPPKSAMAVPVQAKEAAGDKVPVVGVEVSGVAPNALRRRNSDAGGNEDRREQGGDGLLS